MCHGRAATVDASLGPSMLASPGGSAPGMLPANGQEPSLDMLRRALSSPMSSPLPSPTGYAAAVDWKQLGSRNKVFQPERLLGSDMERRYNALFPRLQQTTVLSAPYRDVHGVINPDARWHSQDIEEILDLSVLTVIGERMHQAPAFHASLERCLGISMRQVLPKDRCCHMRKVLHAMLRKLAEALTGKEIFDFVNEYGDTPFHFLACEHHTRPVGLSDSGMVGDCLPDLITPCKTDHDLRAMAHILLRTAPDPDQVMRTAASLNRSGRFVAPSYFQDLYALSPET